MAMELTHQLLAAPRQPMICLIYQELKASFVITPYEDKIYVSARSIDEVNVQLVMEKLGGGGHISIAGAQFTDCTID